jgi:putative Mg2+ transporter-C (MgtC) family protein
MDFVFLFKILLSLILGGIIGWQRQHIGKAAGFRTFALVSVGSTLFTILSLDAFAGDTARVAAQIITGIGFIGAGTIIHKKDSIEGLTTAAGLWAIAAIGMAIGASWYMEAIVSTFVLFLILIFPDKKLIK